MPFGGFDNAQRAPQNDNSIPKFIIYPFSKLSYQHVYHKNVVSRISALLSSNPPECHDWGKGGGSRQCWLCQDFHGA